MQARTLVYQGQKLVVELGNDHALDYSFFVSPLLRVGAPTDLFYLSFSSGVERHAPVVPLNRPGQVDLATNVDFAYPTKVPLPR